MQEPAAIDDPFARIGTHGEPLEAPQERLPIGSDGGAWLEGQLGGPGLGGGHALGGERMGVEEARASRLPPAPQGRVAAQGGEELRDPGRVVAGSGCQALADFVGLPLLVAPVAGDPARARRAGRCRRPCAPRTRRPPRRRSAYRAGRRRWHRAGGPRAGPRAALPRDRSRGRSRRRAPLPSW